MENKNTIDLTASFSVDEMPVTYFNPPFADNGNQSFNIPLFGFDDETGNIRPESVSLLSGKDVVLPSQVTINFACGHADKSERQVGVLTEHVLEMLIERQKQLNARYYSLEGQIILHHLCNALHAQTQHTVNHAKRGVLNQGR